MKKVIDISTEEKKQEVFNVFNNLLTKQQVHEYYGISDNSDGCEYLNQVAKEIGFDFSIYKERKKKPVRYCKQCGKEITNRWANDFCSRSCTATYTNLKRDKSVYEKVASKLRKNPTRGNKKSNKNCEKHEYCVICGKKLEGQRKKYCSEKCSCIGRKMKYEHTCLNCGKNFTGQKKTKFCSNTCASEYYKSLKIEEWINGNLILNPNRKLPQSIRDYILRQNNYKCQECGYEGYNRATGNSILQFHHIDGDTSNNTPENIQLLCPNCHAKTENYMALNKGHSHRDERYKKKRVGGED